MCTHLAAISLMKRSARRFSASGRYQIRIVIQRDVPFVNGRARQAPLSITRREHLHTPSCPLIALTHTPSGRALLRSAKYSDQSSAHWNPPFENPRSATAMGSQGFIQKCVSVCQTVGKGKEVRIPTFPSPKLPNIIM